MSTASEAVRRLSYKVDSDDAVRRIGQVQTAQKGVTTALREGAAASYINEARTALLQSRYAELMKQQQAYQAIFTRTIDSTNAMAAANDNYARSSSLVSDVLRVATKTAVDHAASWLATAGAIGAGVLIFGSLLAVIGPIIFAYKALKAAIDLVDEAWELSGKELEKWRKIAEKAAASGVSTEFFQKISEAAADAKLPVDELTKSLSNLATVSADKLGGSDLQKRLDQLTGAGNFQGNTGVGQLAQANTQEEKFRAIVSLVDQAMAKGERLAALDLTSKFLSPAAQAALAADAEYLRRMLESADKLSKTELVSDESIGRALELQRRYDDAVKILEQRWHPIQDLLTKGGIELRAAWVGIVEAIANGVDWATKLVMKISEIPQTFWDYVRTGANVASRGVAAVAPTLGPVGTAIGAGASLVARSTSDQPVQETNAYGDAVNRLAAGLKNVNAVQQAVAQTNAVQAAVWKDTSKNIEDAARRTAEARDQYDRAKDAIEKHTSRMDADRQSVGLGAGALEEFRARAQLTTAALQAKIPVVGEVAAEIDRLAKAAGAAGEALAKARVSSQIAFERKTLFLSPEDVQIAQQLRSIYGNDIPAALSSSEAAAMRFNMQMRELISLGQEVNRSMFVEFGQNLRNGMSAWEAFQKAGLNALGRIADKLAQMAADQLWSSAFGGSSGGGGLGGLLSGIFGGGSSGGGIGTMQIGSQMFPTVGFHSGGIVGSEPTFERYVNPSHFDNAPRFHGGGIAGDEVPIIARKGEGVFTEGQMKALGGGGQQVNVTYAPVIDARGADATAVARLAGVIADDRKNFERNVKAVMAEQRRNNPGW